MKLVITLWARLIKGMNEALVLGDIDFDEDIHDALVDARNIAMLFAKMETEEEFQFISYYLG